MRKSLVVWVLCVSLLLIGSVASAGDYDILVVDPGGTITAGEETLNCVEDPYIEGCRELQVLSDNIKKDVNEAPAREGRGFVNGMILGVPIGIIFMLL